MSKATYHVPSMINVFSGWIQDLLYWIFALILQFRTFEISLSSNGQNFFVWKDFYFGPFPRRSASIDLSFCAFSQGLNKK